jgi:hypothetical protein
VPQAISVSNTSDSVVQYLGIVTTKTGGDLYLVNSSTIRVVGSTILPAPPPLPPTDKSQFIVVINTTYLPNNVITSVSQNGTDELECISPTSFSIEEMTLAIELKLPSATSFFKFSIWNI